jgi:sialate O-acetylesterase
MVGYFFGKAIQEKLGVPVGIITSAIGGTQIETWTTQEAYAGVDMFGAELYRSGGKVGGLAPGEWYDKMISPLVPFAVKGFLWYQGENNCGKRDRLYAEKFKVLVESWRETFLLPDAPFYYVLLAPHIYSDRRHNRKTYPVTAEDLPIFREQQIRAAKMVVNCDYVVVTDLVDYLTDIHPSYKWEVGERLARIAMAMNYGKPETVWSGPRLRDTKIQGDSIVLGFDHCAGGLKANDGKLLNWFEIAAEDGIFHPAFAEIRGSDRVVVYLPEIKRPVDVRLGWHETAMPNLVNSEGLPVAPFSSTR